MISKKHLYPFIFFFIYCGSIVSGIGIQQEITLTMREVWWQLQVIRSASKGDNKAQVLLFYMYSGDSNSKIIKPDREIAHYWLHQALLDNYSGAFRGVGQFYYKRGKLVEALKYYQLARKQNIKFFQEKKITEREYMYFNESIDYAEKYVYLKMFFPKYVLCWPLWIQQSTPPARRVRSNVLSHPSDREIPMSAPTETRMAPNRAIPI